MKFTVLTIWVPFCGTTCMHVLPPPPQLQNFLSPLPKRKLRTHCPPARTRLPGPGAPTASRSLCVCPTSAPRDRGVSVRHPCRCLASCGLMSSGHTHVWQAAGCPSLLVLNRAPRAPRAPRAGRAPRAPHAPRAGRPPFLYPVHPVTCPRTLGRFRHFRARHCRHRCVGVRVSSWDMDAEAGWLGRLPRSCLAVSPCGSRSSRAREPRLPPQILSWPALVISQLRHSSRHPGGAPQ